MLSEKADGKMAKAGLIPRVAKISSYGESCNFCTSRDYAEVYQIKGPTLIVRICPDCFETVTFMISRIL